MKNINQIISEASGVDLQLSLDTEDLIYRLKDAFCEEMNAWYQYYIIEPFLVGQNRKEIAADYNENGKEELKHASILLERINQLGGSFDEIDTPNTWNIMASHKYIKPTVSNVEDSLKQMINAERGAIKTYTELEEYTRDKDVVTNTKVKEILADEQTHLQEMLEFLDDLHV